MKVFSSWCCVVGGSMVVAVIVLVVAACRLVAQPGTWSVQKEFRSAGGGVYSMTSIAAVDTLHCVTAGWSANTNTIWRTTDGGKEWKIVRSDELAEFAHYEQVAAVSPRFWLVIGDSGRVLRTTDGGETWLTSTCDTRVNDAVSLRLHRIAMYDSLHGVVAGGSKVLARTDDGGATWQRIPTPPGAADSMATVEVKCFGAGSYLTLAGTQAFRYIFRTEDGGVHWTRYDAGKQMAGVHFLDSVRGWGVGYEPTGFGQTQYAIVYRTDDGGRTWRQVYHDSLHNDFGIFSLSFADREHALAIGRGAVVLWTGDGGEHWQGGADLQALYSAFNAAAITYPHPSRAWAVSVVGQVLVYNDPALAGGVDRGAELVGAGDLDVSPNPVRSGGTVGYAVSGRGRVRLVVVDALGREVARLVDEDRESGEYQAVLDVARWSRGTYFLRLEHGGRVSVRRLIVE